MKQIFVIVAGFGLNLAAIAQPAVEYRFEILPSGTGTPAYYSINGTMLASASNFNAGTGLSGPVGYTQGASLTNTLDKAYWGSNWTMSNVIDPNDWFGFTMTPLPGYLLAIDSLVFWERKSNTGPSVWHLRRGPLFNTTIAAGPTTPGSASPIQTPFGKHVITAGLPNFNAPLELRIYGTSSTNVGGTLRIDTVRVYTHIISILPVELVSFEGVPFDDRIELSWITATERNNDYFTVFHSTDAASWYELSREPGAGSSASPSEYRLPHFSPLRGMNYYRLCQTDIDGTQEELRVIAIPWGARDGPIRILDATGRVFRDWSTTPDLSGLPAGMYVLEDASGIREKIIAP